MRVRIYKFGENWSAIVYHECLVAFCNKRTKIVYVADCNAVKIHVRFIDLRAVQSMLRTLKQMNVVKINATVVPAKGKYVTKMWSLPPAFSTVLA